MPSFSFNIFVDVNIILQPTVTAQSLLLYRNITAAARCCINRMYRVPDILFTTIEPPPDLPIIGKGCFIQARICRPKKESRGEANAKEISDVSLQVLCALKCFYLVYSFSRVVNKTLAQIQAK